MPKFLTAITLLSIAVTPASAQINTVMPFNPQPIPVQPPYSLPQVQPVMPPSIPLYPNGTGAYISPGISPSYGVPSITVIPSTPSFNYPYNR